MGASVLPSPEVSLAMGTGWRAGRTGRLPPREEIARPDDGVPSARPDDGVASGLELSPLPSSARYRVLPAIELSPLPSSAKLLVRARIPTISQSSAGGGWGVSRCSVRVGRRVLGARSRPATELSPLSSSARYRAQPATELCEAVGPGADTNYFAELGRGGAGCFAELETGAGYFAELGRGAGVRSSSACCQK